MCRLLLRVSTSKTLAPSGEAAKAGSFEKGPQTVGSEHSSTCVTFIRLEATCETAG
jgi:hypothetical protein